MQRPSRHIVETQHHHYRLGRAVLYGYVVRLRDCMNLTYISPRNNIGTVNGAHHKTGT